MCTNTIGSFTCRCSAGYTGDGESCSGINSSCGAFVYRSVLALTWEHFRFLRTLLGRFYFTSGFACAQALCWNIYTEYLLHLWPKYMKTVFYESKYQCQITKVCATREFVSLDLWIFNNIHKRKQCHCIQVSSSTMCGINWKHDSLKAHRALLCTITRIHIAFILANNPATNSLLLSCELSLTDSARKRTNDSLKPRFFPSRLDSHLRMQRWVQPWRQREHHLPGIGSVDVSSPHLYR